MRVTCLSGGTPVSTLEVPFHWKLVLANYKTVYQLLVWVFLPVIYGFHYYLASINLGLRMNGKVVMRRKKSCCSFCLSDPKKAYGHSFR